MNYNDVTVTWLEWWLDCGISPNGLLITAILSLVNGYVQPGNISNDWNHSQCWTIISHYSYQYPHNIPILSPLGGPFALPLPRHPGLWGATTKCHWAVGANQALRRLTLPPGQLLVNFVGSWFWHTNHWTSSGWWFGTCFIFHNIWNNNPNWLIFFRGVETTNQSLKIILKMPREKYRKSDNHAHTAELVHYIMLDYTSRIEVGNLKNPFRVGMVWWMSILEPGIMNIANIDAIYIYIYICMYTVNGSWAIRGKIIPA